MGIHWEVLPRWGLAELEMMWMRLLLWNHRSYDVVGVDNGEFVWNEETYPIPVLNIYSNSWSHHKWPQYAVNSRLLVDVE